MNIAPAARRSSGSAKWPDTQPLSRACSTRSAKTRVLMVGELREPETMRLTLTRLRPASGARHVHSGTCAKRSSASRWLSGGIRPILRQWPTFLGRGSSDCAPARPQHRVPECEILSPTRGQNFIRKSRLLKIPGLETGAETGMWTFETLPELLAKRTQWHIPNPRRSPR